MIIPKGIMEIIKFTEVQSLKEGKQEPLNLPVWGFSHRRGDVLLEVKFFLLALHCFLTCFSLLHYYEIKNNLKYNVVYHLMLATEIYVWCYVFSETSNICPDRQTDGDKRGIIFVKRKYNRLSCGFARTINSS